jgi:hypothetical protein
VQQLVKRIEENKFAKILLFHAMKIVADQGAVPAKLEGRNHIFDQTMQNVMVSRRCFVCFCASVRMTVWHMRVCVCVFAQSWVGPTWYLDRVQEMRAFFSTQSTVSVAKASPELFESDKKFVAAASIIADCYRKKKSCTHIEESAQQQAADDSGVSRMSGVIDVPIFRELVPAGNFDANTDVKCRRLFLRHAGLTQDPLMTSQLAQAAAETVKSTGTAKSRKPPQVKEAPDEMYCDKDTSHVKVFQKPMVANVAWDAFNIDILSQTRGLVMPPLSKDFGVVYCDLPYGQNMSGIGPNWDQPWTIEQVSILCVTCERVMGFRLSLPEFP